MPGAQDGQRWEVIDEVGVVCVNTSAEDTDMISCYLCDLPRWAQKMMLDGKTYNEYFKTELEDHELARANKKNAYTEWKYFYMKAGVNDKQIAEWQQLVELVKGNPSTSELKHTRELHNQEEANIRAVIMGPKFAGAS